MLVKTVNSCESQLQTSNIFPSIIMIKEPHNSTDKNSTLIKTKGDYPLDHIVDRLLPKSESERLFSLFIKFLKIKVYIKQILNIVK